MVRLRTRWVLAAALLSALASNSTPASEPSSQDALLAARPYSRAFTSRDGLPQSTVTALTVDATGRLWVGTQDGAAVYNGRRWTTVRVPDQLAGNYINALLASRDGAVWFGASSGLYRLAHGTWTVYGPDAGLPHYQVTALLESVDADGRSTLWVGTHAGLARLANGTLSSIGVVDGLPSPWVRALAETTAADGTRSLWIGTDAGLARLEGGTLTTYTTAEGLPHASVRVFLETVRPDGGRSLWIGTTGGLARLEGGRWTAYRTADGLPDNLVSALAETTEPGGDRTLWVGTAGGLARRVGERWVTYTDRDGLPDRWVTVMLATPGSGATRTLWAGTAEGLAQFVQGTWSTIDDGTGLPDDLVVSLLDAAGPRGQPAMWFGTASGLACLENGVWTVYDADGPLPGNWVSSLCESVAADGARTLWVGTDAGLARFERGRWSVFDTTTGLPHATVHNLLATHAADGSQELWIGTDGGGLARLSGGAFEVFDTSRGLPHDVVGQIVETHAPDGTRTLWACTNGGLARFERGRWTTYGVGSGLPANNVTTALESRTADGRTLLWVGMSGGGAARFEPYAAEPNWVYFNEETESPLPNNVVYQIRSDAAGRIYMFTNKGVARLTSRTPEAGDPRDYAVFTFTTEDGLPSDECNIGAATVDRYGRVWAGTISGAAVFDVSREVVDRAPKALALERVSVIGRNRAVAASDVLSYRENSVSFEYSLVSLVHEGDTRYRTHLVGYEDTPTDWTPDAKREITNLPAGAYVLRVWGRDYLGNVSGPVDLPFEIRPAPWQTWWAWALYIASLAAALWSLYRLRVGALERRSRLLEARVGERTAELDRKNDELAEKVEELRLSREEVTRKNEELAVRNEELDRKNSELIVQQLIELERLRLRIATDLHDDVGSSLTQIAVLSEVARQRAEDTGVTEPLAMIANGSRELVAAISDIVWAINPQRDRMHDLTQRMRRFASDVLTASNIELRFRVTTPERDVSLDADMRRQIYLIFKEAINNIARHSRCANTEVVFGLDGDILSLEIRDDGRGFDAAETGDGHGLMSMQRRAADLSGTLAIETSPGEGTELRLRVPIVRGAANATGA